MNIAVQIKTPPATYQDIIDAPENMVAEIIYGHLSLQPQPASPHQRVTSVLGGKVGDPFDYGDNGPGGWVILDEPEVHLGDNVVVPDLAGWRRERMPHMPETPFFTLAPDWACEVLSPSTMRHDRIEKRQIYAEAGVEFLWHIDPTEKTLEAFRLQDGNWVLTHVRSDDNTCDVPPFEAAPFNLGVLWSR